MPDAPLTVAVDRAMWSTIVTNLVSNAVKYTTHGGIRIRLTATDTDAVLTVADTGAGSTPSSRNWCSTGSTGRPGHEKAPGSGWRSWPTWSTPTTAASTWTAPPAGAAPSPSPSHAGHPRRPRRRPRRLAAPALTGQGARTVAYCSSRTTPTCGSSSPGCSPGTGGRCGRSPTPRQRSGRRNVRRSRTGASPT